MLENRPCVPIFAVGGALWRDVRELQPTEIAERPPMADPARGESTLGPLVEEVRLMGLLPPISLAPSTALPLLEAVCRIRLLVGPAEECTLDATRPTGEFPLMGLSCLLVC